DGALHGLVVRRLRDGGRCGENEQEKTSSVFHSNLLYCGVAAFDEMRWVAHQGCGDAGLKPCATVTDVAVHSVLLLLRFDRRFPAPAAQARRRARKGRS